MTMIGVINYLDKKFPWYGCDGLDMCYQKILDPNDPLNYLVVPRAEALYELKKRDACDKATILETTDGSSSGGNEASFGWYLSSSVPEPILLKLNQEILKLKLNGDLDNIFEEVIGNAKLCGVAKLAISPLVLLIPLALVMGPPIILVVIVLLHKRIKIEKQ